MRKMARSCGGLALSLSLLAGCGLQGTDPQTVLDHAVSGLSGKDNFAFTGKTQLSMGGLPPVPGISFRGMVSGHNQLLMQVVAGETTDGTLSPKQVELSRRSKGATVQLSRSKDEWIVSEGPEAAEAGQLVRWNPLSHLERLNVMPKQVSREKGASVPSGTIVLNVTPDAGEVAARLRADLDAELQTLTADRKLQELQQRLQLSDKTTAAMRGEVEKSLADSRAKVEEMKNSLKAESVYRIGVDRKSNLPVSMQVMTKLHYNSGGAPKDETTEVTYAFGE
ncbi:hypothetical protein [Paenibacillus sp. HJGM_3]|uniref:hypothetical protein n=1 Tax=Paenibacillus sp. HJGM_3 TaxID=3379816 RepID=UPI00385ED10E